MGLLLTCATELPVGGVKYPLSPLPKPNKGGFSYYIPKISRNGRN